MRVRMEYVLAMCSMPLSRLFDMQHDNFQKKNVLTFDPTPGVDGVCKDRIGACMLMHLSFRLIFHRKHDHVLKKLKFDLLTPPPMDGRERDL